MNFVAFRVAIRRLRVIQHIKESELIDLIMCFMINERKILKLSREMN
jgi:hypothetical protein